VAATLQKNCSPSFAASAITAHDTASSRKAACNPPAALSVAASWPGGLPLAACLASAQTLRRGGEAISGNAEDRNIEKMKAWPLLKCRLRKNTISAK